MASALSVAINCTSQADAARVAEHGALFGQLLWQAGELERMRQKGSASRSGALNDGVTSQSFQLKLCLRRM